MGCTPKACTGPVLLRSSGLKVRRAVTILGLVGPLFFIPSRPLSLLTHLGPLPSEFPPTFTYL